MCNLTKNACKVSGHTEKDTYECSPYIEFSLKYLMMTNTAECLSRSCLQVFGWIVVRGIQTKYVEKWRGLVSKIGFDMLMSELKLIVTLYCGDEMWCCLPIGAKLDNTTRIHSVISRLFFHFHMKSLWHLIQISTGINLCYNLIILPQSYIALVFTKNYFAYRIFKLRD